MGVACRGASTMADPSGPPGRELEEVGIVDVNVGWTSRPPTAGPSVDGQRLYTVGGHTALDTYYLGVREDMASRPVMTLNGCWKEHLWVQTP